MENSVKQLILFNTKHLTPDVVKDNTSMQLVCHQIIFQLSNTPFSESFGSWCNNTDSTQTQMEENIIGMSWSEQENIFLPAAKQCWFRKSSLSNWTYYF